MATQRKTLAERWDNLFMGTVLTWWSGGALFQEFLPRTYSAIQWVGNRLMMLIILALLVIPPYFAKTGDITLGKIWLVSAIITLLLSARYALWYTAITPVPYVILYAIVGATMRGDFTGNYVYDTPVGTMGWIVMWYWVWTLYPLVKGLFHIAKWERERRAGLPNHLTAKHPYLAATTAVGIAVGAHYALKRD